jgi:hypothetical protein
LESYIIISSYQEKIRRNGKIREKRRKRRNLERVKEEKNTEKKGKQERE